MTIEAEVYHLFHSGVAIKIENQLLIFDYYNDTPAGGKRNLANGVISQELLAQTEQVSVFVTHAHHDHFNQIIYDWEEYNQNINYFLSSDIDLGAKLTRDNYYQLQQYQELELLEMKIETYGTTDQGLSYYVEVAGLNIFHSGDLNWWHWNKFSPEERKVEEKQFKSEVARFKDTDLDIAFVPVDPRLEEHYYLAGEYFAQTVGPQLLVPLHFSDNYYITSDFAEKISDLDVEAAVINSRGEKIKFTK
jgi:L-ascorbate metabolism protein UlaG (beta-lactamase superfamily)